MTTAERPSHNMFDDKFTERAKKVLSFAKDEADRLQNPLIEPPYIIVGLIREGDGLAAKVLARLGVKLDELRLALGVVVERADPTFELSSTLALNPDAMSFSPRGKRAIQLAIDEARHLNHHYIGTEHLLLGFMAEGQEEPKSETATILENNFGVTLEKIREETMRILSASVPQSLRSVTSFYRRRRLISPEASDVSNVIAGWETFLNSPSMTEEARKGYVEILTTLFEKTVKEYNDQQQSTN